MKILLRPRRGLLSHITVMEKTDKPIYLPLSNTAVKWLPERGDVKDGDEVFE